jgi:hypothetical protein
VLFNIILPYLAYRRKQKLLLQHSGKSELTKPEEQFILDPFEGVSVSIGKYAELAIQFGTFSGDERV